MADVCCTLAPEWTAAFNYINHLTRMEIAFEHQQTATTKISRQMLMNFVLKAVNGSTRRCGEMKSRDSGKPNILPSAVLAYNFPAGKSSAIFQYNCRLLKAFMQLYSLAAYPSPSFLMLLFFHVVLGNCTAR